MDTGQSGVSIYHRVEIEHLVSATVRVIPVRWASGDGHGIDLDLCDLGRLGECYHFNTLFRPTEARQLAAALVALADEIEGKV